MRPRLRALGLALLAARSYRRITPEGVDHLDVEGFSALVRELLELGAFTSFYEYELKRSAHRYGRVFHIASAYETKAAPDAVDYLERGVNSLRSSVSKTGGAS